MGEDVGQASGGSKGWGTGGRMKHGGAGSRRAHGSGQAPETDRCREQATRGSRQGGEGAAVWFLSPCHCFLHHSNRGINLKQPSTH